MKTLATMLLAAVVGAAGLSACASNQVTPESKYSGFLPNYSLLTKQKDPKGQPVMRYVNPLLTSGDYHAVMIDPVVYYPAPQPDKAVNAETLSQIREYFDSALHSEVGSEVQVVNAPGPGVARIRVAITAVAPKSASLKWYQYIPIALLVQGVKAAAGVYPKDAQLFAEMEVTDSQSGQLLGEVVKNATGTEIEKAKEGVDKGKKVVALDNVKSIFDNWAKLIANFMAENLGS